MVTPNFTADDGIRYKVTIPHISIDILFEWMLVNISQKIIQNNQSDVSLIVQI